jgi:hypothetical protein
MVVFQAFWRLWLRRKGLRSDEKEKPFRLAVVAQLPPVVAPVQGEKHYHLPFDKSGKVMTYAAVRSGSLPRCAPRDSYRIFPASMTVSGLMLCLEGRLYMGRLYIFGLLDFLIAIVLAIRLDLAPLVFAVWNSLVLLWMAWYMQRRRKRDGSTKAGADAYGRARASGAAG